MSEHDHLARLVAGSDRAQIGMWLATGDPVAAEICAAAGLDWLVVDTEHAPNDLRSVLRQLQVLAGYPVCPVVRPAVADTVLLKQLLDIGARNFIVPMIDSAEAAEAVVRAVRYPPRGVRGVGATLARSSRWGLVGDYFEHADDDVTVIVQAETMNAIAALESIAAVDGVDGVFIGPADLAGSMGLLGQAGHPDVVATVERALTIIAAAGKIAGVNTFDETLAARYRAAGANLLSVGADVTLLARGARTLASTFIAATQVDIRY